MWYIIDAIVFLIIGVLLHKYYSDKANAEQAKLSAAVEQAKTVASQVASDIRKA